jgi:hypothetical protein
MSAEAAFAARQLEWHKASTDMETQFLKGRDEVSRILGKSPEARTAWNTEWKKKYAADNTADFQTLFTRVFDNVGDHEPEGDLQDAISRAVAE